MKSLFQRSHRGYIGLVRIFVSLPSDNAQKLGLSPAKQAIANREWNLKWQLTAARRRTRLAHGYLPVQMS